MRKSIEENESLPKFTIGQRVLFSVMLPLILFLAWFTAELGLGGINSYFFLLDEMKRNSDYLIFNAPDLVSAATIPGFQIFAVGLTMTVLLKTLLSVEHKKLLQSVFFTSILGVFLVPIFLFLIKSEISRVEENIKKMNMSNVKILLSLINSHSNTKRFTPKRLNCVISMKVKKRGQGLIRVSGNIVLV